MAGYDPVDAGGKAVIGAGVEDVDGRGDGEAGQAGVDELDLGQVEEEVGRVDEEEGLLVEEGEDVGDVDVGRLEELDEGVEAHEEEARLAGEGDDLDLALLVAARLQHVGHERELVVGPLDGALEQQRERDELLLAGVQRALTRGSQTGRIRV